MEESHNHVTPDPLPGPDVLGSRRPKQFHTRIVWLGVVQLVLGLLILFIGILDLAFSFVAFDVFYLAKVGAGIWIGIAVIATGCVGVVTSRSQLRRHTTLILFLCLSAISFVLCIVLISIAISEMVSGAFAEGTLEQQQRDQGITDMTACFNQTSTDSGNNTRCISKTTFNQKTASAAMAIVFGLSELLISFYSIVITKQIIDREFGTWNLFNPGPNESVGTGRDLTLPGMTVSDYFGRHDAEDGGVAGPYNHVEEHQSTNLHGSSRTGSQRHVQNQSVSSREFPDSEQFRSHLEVINNQY
ncbi:uncharacterized protein LOC100175592 [Ciona intestinalis]